MNIYEFEMWLRYYKECPFGDYRADLREALSCKLILAPYTESDLPLNTFMLIKGDMKEQEEAKPVANLVDKTKAMFRGMGAK